MIDKKFIRKYNSYIKQQLSRSGVRPEDTRDLIQDVYEKAQLYEDYYENDWATGIKSYLYFIIRHVINRKYRSKDVLDHCLSLDSRVSEDGEKFSMHEVITEQDSVFEESDSYYLNNTPEVQYYLDHLQDKMRKVLEHKLILSYTHKEVADILHITESDSKQTLKRGIEQLKKLVTGDDDVEILQHKMRGIHQQSIRTNDESGTDVWSDWSFRPHIHGEVKVFTQDEIDDYLKGEK